MHAAPPLAIELKRSREGALLFLALHGIGAAGVLAAGLPFWLVVPALAGLGWSLAQLVRRHVVLAHTESLIRLKFHPDGRAECLTRDGEWLGLHLLDDSTLFPFFALLILAPEGGGRRRHALVFRDTLAAEDWRQLRVWLRWATSGHDAPQA